MPELPDLEIIREVLSPRLTGQTLSDTRPPGKIPPFPLQSGLPQVLPHPSNSEHQILDGATILC